MMSDADEGLGIGAARRAVVLSLAAGTLMGMNADALGPGVRSRPQDASDDLDRAIVARDISVLDKLIAEDFLWVRGGGVRADKSAFLANFVDANVRLDPIKPSLVRWIESGDLAICTAFNELRGLENGVPFVDRHSFCDVWRRDHGAWRLTYTQITRAPSTS